LSQVKAKKIESTIYMKKILKDYYIELDKASESSNTKVAWCSSAGPAELLRAFGIKVFFPENHSAIIGAQRFATDMIPIANAQGYSPDICTYLTSDIGSYLSGFTPLTKMYGIEKVPKPDVLVYNTNQCRDVQDWFRFYANHYNVPLIGIHSPSFVPEVTEADVQNVSAQMKALVPELEKVTDQSFELNRLRETVRYSSEATLLWKDVLRSAQSIPSPITFFDSCIQMALIVVLRGDPIAVNYYKQLKEEMQERINNNISAVESETVRLYWEGMPLWGKLRSLSNLFAEHQTAVVASTYCNSWVFDAFDDKYPFESMARAYTELFINRDESYKQNYLKQMANDFKIDGIIYHDCKTCPNNSNNRYQLPQRLQEETNLPFIVINGDVNDLRLFSEEQSQNTIEAFIEQIGVQKELAYN
jgi:benzoyl-CoA reductase/2-hydroxyglutaryl-CoA dehydratase subunit BcrC/BadD/HgdB